MAAGGSYSDAATDLDIIVGQTNYVCRFNYTGYYAAASACAAGQCLGFCPASYTTNGGLLYRLQQRSAQLGYWGNQGNVTAYDVCENGQWAGWLRCNILGREYESPIENCVQ